MGPFGKFDGVHEISAWRFASNEACKYYFPGLWRLSGMFQRTWTPCRRTG